MKFNVCAMHTVHCLSWLSVQYNNKKLHFGFLFNQWFFLFNSIFLLGGGGGGGGLGAKKLIKLRESNERLTLAISFLYTAASKKAYLTFFLWC